MSKEEIEKWSDQELIDETNKWITRTKEYNNIGWQDEDHTCYMCGNRAATLEKAIQANISQSHKDLVERVKGLQKAERLGGIGESTSYENPAFVSAYNQALDDVIKELEEK